MTSRWRIAMPWLLILLAALGAAWIRYGFIEPADLAHVCEGTAVPGWCPVRNTLVQGFRSYGYGYAALAGTLLALVWRHPLSATLAAALGLIALELYCYEAGALALLVGALRLVRLQATGAMPGDEDGRGNAQVQPGP
jgi:hypothetical protein